MALPFRWIYAPPSYKGKPVQTVSVILLKIENTGNQPITESDYSEPIRISLAQNSQVNDVSVQETRPEGIHVTSTLPSSNQIVLAKLLLNPGDQAVLRVLALNNDGTLTIEGRIAGITEIDKVTGLQSSNAGSQSLSPGEVLARLAFLGLIVGAVLAALAISVAYDSWWFNAWRKKYFAYDPAPRFYRSAREQILRGQIGNAIAELNRAFRWDKGYVEKSKKDSVFLSIQDYEPYKRLIVKYELSKSESREN